MSAEHLVGCLTYCTKPCTSTAACGGANSCLSTPSGFLCIPFCQTDADCSVFGAAASCQAGTDPGGLATKGCFAR